MKKVIIVGLFLLIFMPLISADSCNNFYVTNKDVEHALDITLISDFPAGDNIKYRAQELVDYMKDTSPFNEFIGSKINIRYVEVSEPRDLSCCKSSFIPFCNQIKVANLAKLCPTDEIIVFSDKGSNPACSDYGGGIGVFGQHSLIAKPIGEVTPELLVHELGHSMAFLGDEYVYTGIRLENADDSYLKKFNFINFPNCERNPICENNNCQCPKWRNVPGTGCFKGCTLDNWYREQDMDIMENFQMNLGPVDTMQFRSAMNRYVDYVMEPMSVELNKKATDFITEKFLQNNKEGVIGIVPFMKYDEAISNEAGTLLIDTAISVAFPGIITAVCTGKFHIKNSDTPKVTVYFEHIEVDYSDSINNNIIVYFTTKIKGKGTAQVYSDDGVITSPTTLGLLTWFCSDGIIDVDWETMMDPVVMKATLHFNNGPLGIIEVEPNLEYIQFPNEGSIRDGTKFDYSLSQTLTDIKIDLPDNVVNDILNIVLQKEETPTYKFAREIKNSTVEFEYTLKKKINDNLDDFGLSLKASLDLMGLGELGGMGKPHGMIFDFYMRPIPGGLTQGVEIDSQTGEESLRLSGPVSLNSPLDKNMADCVKGLNSNFQPIDYTEFDRKIPNKDSFASIKLSQTFPNWFLATLWNGGYFCSKKNLLVTDLPSIIPPIENIFITKAEYLLTPLSAPSIDYSSFEDINNDGVIDFENDIVVKGDAKINLIIEYTTSQNDDKIQESINIVFNYVVPLLIEESDITSPLSESGEGFTFAQSFLKPDRDNIRISFNEISCSNKLICSYIRLPAQKELLSNEIKESMASHIQRGVSEVSLNPVRDIDLNFGEFGGDYFSPPLNFSYGEYIAKMKTREIDKKWMIYDFDLIEKCSSSDYCGPASGAFISNVEEVYYKDGKECRINPLNIEQGQECFNLMQSEIGDIDQYYVVTYTSTDPFISYNYNLISWNNYKPTIENEVKIENKVYLAKNKDTYNKLMESKRTGIGEGEVENIPNNINADVHLLNYLADGTSILAVRGKTAKGVEQGFNCMSAVIFDKDCNTFECFPEIVKATIKPTLRADTNDNYVICEETYQRRELISKCFDNYMCGKPGASS